MTITLSPAQEAIVREKVASGHFKSPGDVITMALEQISENEVPLTLDELKSDISIGLADEERGDLAVLNVDAIMTQGRNVITAKKHRG